MAVDLGLSLFISTGILLVLAFITTTCRCIARIYIVQSFGLDDWLMVLTLVDSHPSFASHQLTKSRQSLSTTLLGFSMEEVLIKVDKMQIFLYQMWFLLYDHSTLQRSPSQKPFHKNSTLSANDS
jgi:hypothetical protein